MITQDSYPIDIAYNAVHEALQKSVCGACAAGDAKLKWRAARSLIAIEKKMGTRKRFTDGIRGATRSRRAAGDDELIREALIEAIASLNDLILTCESDSDAPPAEKIKRARTMIRDAISSVFESYNEARVDEVQVTLVREPPCPAWSIQTTSFSLGSFQASGNEESGRAGVLITIQKLAAEHALQSGARQVSI